LTFTTYHHAVQTIVIAGLPP